jgi:hypothetical protein
VLSGFTVNWQVVHPEDGLPLGCHGDVTAQSCVSLIPRQLQGDCREDGSEQTQIQIGDRCFSPLLVNLWAQEGVSAFQFCKHPLQN